MERFSPKIEIINHFDNLINRIDIDIDSSLKKFNDKQLLFEILTSSKDKRFGLINIFNNFNVEFFDTSKPNLNSWPETTKAVDYLKQIRMRTIEELKNAQEETIEYYKLNSDRFKSELTNIEEMKSQLFAEKFYFQVHLKRWEKRLCLFNVFTFVTDFYMPQFYIDSLENLINAQIEPFDRNIIFDDKMVLTGLLFKCFNENLLHFPAHVIRVRKEDVLNIRSIVFVYQYSGVNLTNSSIDLSKLENLHLFDRKFVNFDESVIKFSIESLSSLKRLQLLAITDNVDFSMKNLSSLTNFSLTFSGSINEDFARRLFDQLPNIEELHLGGNLSYFNLDDLVNLRVLSLGGKIDENFNLELFKNLCDQLEDIKISLANIDETTLFKLFDGYEFPYLVDFTLMYVNVKRLKKEFMNGFSTLRQLNLSRNRIEFIEENSFSSLKSLQKLDLTDTKLTKFDRDFIGLAKSVKLTMENNNINS